MLSNRDFALGEKSHVSRDETGNETKIREESAKGAQNKHVNFVRDASPRIFKMDMRRYRNSATVPAGIYVFAFQREFNFSLETPRGHRHARSYRRPTFSVTLANGIIYPSKERESRFPAIYFFGKSRAALSRDSSVHDATAMRARLYQKYTTEIFLVKPRRRKSCCIMANLNFLCWHLQKIE